MKHHDLIGQYFTCSTISAPDRRVHRAIASGSIRCFAGKEQCVVYRPREYFLGAICADLSITVSSP